MEKIKKLEDGIFLKVIPLKGNPLKSINIYIIKSKGEAAIIDTGFNTEEIKNYHLDFHRELNLNLKNTKLILTHLHSDHTGLASWYNSLDVPIYMSSEDYEIMDLMRDASGPRWKFVKELSIKQGFYEDKLKIEEHSGFKYRPKEHVEVKFLNPGDKLNVGEFSFDVLDFSGHTPGMIGLYEREKGYLFCGDHILGDITPNITYWTEEFGDSLGIYLKHLEYVKKLNVKNLYSSHRSLIKDINLRIDEIKNHHKKRLEETMAAVEKYGKVTVKDVTKNLHWDIKYEDFDDFPRPQKWFAAGEAHAHLEHLKTLGYLKEEEKGGLLYFSKIKDFN